MLARLTFFQPDRPSRQFLLDEGDSYVIGRDADCAIHFEDSGLSRRHARLRFAEGSWRLADLCSKNGTLIAGRPVGEAVLTETQWIEFGDLLACFDRVSEQVIAEDRERLSHCWQTSIELSRTLEPALSHADLLERVLKSFVDMSGTERGFVMLYQGEGEFRVDARLPVDAGRFSGSRGVVHRCFEEQRALACSDVSANAELGNRPSIRVAGLSALACVPLRVGERMLGVIYVDSRAPGKQFTALDMEILEALAGHAALVIGVARVRGNIVDLSAMLPDGLEHGREADPVLVERLQNLLPPIDTALLSAGVAAAGADR